MDFSQPVELPAPDLNIDDATNDLVGSWIGSDSMLSTIGTPHLTISQTAGGVVGEVYWELAPGSELSGPFQAPTNPNVGYPTELGPTDYGQLRQPTPRVHYRMFDGVFAAARLSFWTSPLDLWSDWCAMQKSYPHDVAGTRVYHCVPESAAESNTDLGKLVLCTSIEDGSAKTINMSDPLWSLAYCECGAASCRADLRAGTITADLELEGTILHGPVSVGFMTQDYEFTKVAQ
jgi:hypothetical protein